MLSPFYCDRRHIYDGCKQCCRGNYKTVFKTGRFIAEFYRTFTCRCLNRHKAFLRPYDIGIFLPFTVAVQLSSNGIEKNT